MGQSLAEKPCIYFKNTPHKPEGPGGEKRERAHTDCLANSDDECPKDRNKCDISMLCFRIRKTKPKKEKEP